MRSSSALAAAAAVTTVAAAALVPPAAAPSTAAARSGTTYYVDCADGDDSAPGTGQGSAWRTLAKASARTYAPGDRVLFARGTRCLGTFAPKGSGTAEAPIRAGAYGDRAARGERRAARPEIAGGGARAAVLLENVEGWELRGLRVTNKGPATTTEPRAGILVRLTDHGMGRHYVVEDNEVRDVNGADVKDVEGSGGILFAAAGEKRPTAFDRVTVRRNSVAHVDRTGIGTASTWGKRPEHPNGPGTTFAPITRLAVRGNDVRDVGGDGIVTHNAVGARVEHNRVHGFNMRSAGYNAGVWSWNSDRVVTQFNEVSGGHGTRDSQAFDIDGGNNGNVIQYNYSHDNEGGFLLVCNGDGMTSDRNTVRYNVSLDDQNRSAPYGVVSVVCGPSTRTLVHNNTIATGVEGTPLVSGNGPGGVTFRNNVLAGAPGGSAVSAAPNTFDHNLYFRVPQVPSGDGGAATGDPLFTGGAGGTTPGSPEGIALLKGSPALGAGVAVPDDGGRDYFGNPVPDTPDLGAYHGGPR
ncbi:hypothetical protein GCM10009801_64950 [Streptomyces albiaxialis]|uniref:Right handed beta helix domain-containing protein n=1 Tax=Streptomyces albiaxialis TaxID=329523 RepID=A0ABN2WN56_9ACTN